jgi:hypothetical protein
MPITVDPDFVSQNREVYIDTALRQFRIVTDTSTSPVQSPISRIDSDGLAGQALYSFFKEEWKNDATLIPHPFPMIAITPEQFEFINDWEPRNDVTRKLIKTAGWREIDEFDRLKKEFAGIISLGTFAEATDQAYYQQGTDTADTAAATNFDRPDAVNEPLLIYEEIVPADTTSPGHTFTANTITRNDGGSFLTDGFAVGARVVVIGDTSSSPSKDGTYVLTDVSATVLTVSGSPWTGITGSSQDARLAKEFRNALTLYLREGFDAGFGTGKTYDSANLNDIGVTTLTYQAYRFPLTNAADLKVTNSDATIAARSPEVTITYYSSPQTFSGFVADASSTNSPQTTASFGIVIDAQQYTAEEVYEFIQYQLRQAADINDGGSPITVVAGNIADELLEFVGDSLQTLSATNPLGGGTGVYITNFNSNDTNRISFADNEFGTTARRTFPFVAAGSINFNANLVSDSMGMFWMFYEYTERFTGAITLSSAAGASAILDMPSTDLVAELTPGDYIALDGFVTENNNGVYVVNSFNAGVSPQTINVTKWDGETLTNETSPGTATLDKNPINSPDAIIVDSATAFSPLPITGAITGSSIAFDFDYDGNVQGGRTPGGSNDANIIIRAIGLETAQFVEATGTITRAVGLSFTLTAGLERNYSNP